MATGPIDRFKDRWPNAILPPAIIIAVWRGRNIARAFMKGLGSIFTDGQQQLTAAVAVASGFAAVRSGGFAAVFTQAAGLDTWAATVLSSVPIWLLLNALRAPCIAKADEAAKGKFYGNKFVYHEPVVIGLVEWRPEDNGTWKLIAVQHPQRDSFANIELSFHPKTDRIKAAVVWVWNQHSPFMKDYTHKGGEGVRINRGRLWVTAESQPGTIPVIIRVYCHSFVVGKGDVND